MRDDFSQKTKDVLFRRAQAKCSNPECRRPTSQAHSEADKAINLGEAAHITAASPGGYRYDSSLTAAERKSINNAIWLCGTCAKLIDSDEPKYTIALLQEWKRVVEAGDEHKAAKMAMFHKLEKKLPALLEAMRKDLADYPLVREIVLLHRGMNYTSVRGTIVLVYYYEDHDQLEDKMTILYNYQLLADSTRGSNVKKYQIMEDLADYLTLAE